MGPHPAPMSPGASIPHQFCASSRDRRVPRDILPLPEPAVGPSQRLAAGLSRGCAQRSQRRFAAAADLGRAVRALNCMYTHTPPFLSKGARHNVECLSAGQRRVFDHLEDSISELGRPPPGLTPAEALRTLRVASWYDIGDAKLGSYDLAAVSLPPV